MSSLPTNSGVFKQVSLLKIGPSPSKPIPISTPFVVNFARSLLILDSGPKGPFGRDSDIKPRPHIVPPMNPKGGRLFFPPFILNRLALQPDTTSEFLRPLDPTGKSQQDSMSLLRLGNLGGQPISNLHPREIFSDTRTRLLRTRRFRQGFVDCRLPQVTVVKGRRPPYARGPGFP